MLLIFCSSLLSKIYAKDFVIPFFKTASAMISTGGTMILANGVSRYERNRNIAENAWDECGFTLRSDSIIKRTRLQIFSFTGNSGKAL